MSLRCAEKIGLGSSQLEKLALRATEKIYGKPDGSELRRLKWAMSVYIMSPVVDGGWANSAFHPFKADKWLVSPRWETNDVPPSLLTLVLWRLVSATLCWRWSHCLADQLWLLMHTQEEEDWVVSCNRMCATSLGWRRLVNAYRVKAGWFIAFVDKRVGGR